jgi:hypothetical protein
MAPRVRRSVPVALKIFVGVAGFALVVLVSGDDRGMFNAPAKLLFCATVGVGLLTMADGAVGAWREHRGGKRGEAEARVQKALVGLMLEVSKESSVDLEFLGTSLFAVAWRWVRLPGDAFLGHPRRVLERRMRFRVRDHSQPSAFARLKGKAAIGECWETGRVVHRPWQNQSARYGRSNLTKAEFNSISPAEQDRFTFEEFRGIAHKYSEVLAAPVLSEGGVVLGVLSLDVAVQAGQSGSVLDTPAIEVQMDMAAMVVRDDLKRLYPLE